MLSFLKKLDDMAGASVEDSSCVLLAGVKAFFLVIFYLHIIHLFCWSAILPLYRLITQG